MAQPINTDFYVDEGSDFVKTLTIFDSSGVPIDLTGYTFAGQARLTVQDSTAYSFSFTLHNQITSPGKVDWVIAKTVFQPLSLTKTTNFVYDVEMTDASALTKRILRGTLKVSPEVTR